MNSGKMLERWFKIEPEDKVIKRFEDIFENKDKKLQYTILLDQSITALAEIYKEKGLNSLRLAKALHLVFKVQPGKEIKNISAEILDIVRNFKLLVLKKEDIIGVITN